jgi:hypothetical protein
MVWFACLSATLIIEFVGYKVLRIREMGGHPPLVFGLVHGTPLLKFCYFFAAPIAIGSVALVKKILSRMPFCEAGMPVRQKES